MRMLDDRPTVPHLDVTLAPVPASVRRARHRVGQTIAGYPEEVCTTVALLTSELASNAVVHAKTPFTVTATVDREIIRVAVSDEGGRQRPAIPVRDSTTEGGWGLSMVATAANRWGIDDAGERMTVWFEIDINDPR